MLGVTKKGKPTPTTTASSPAPAPDNGRVGGRDLQLPMAAHLPPPPRHRSEAYAQAAEHVANLEAEVDNLRGQVHHLNALLDVAESTNKRFEQELADSKAEFKHDIAKTNHECDYWKRSAIRLRTRLDVIGQNILDALKEPAPEDPDADKPRTELVPEGTELVDVAMTDLRNALDKPLEEEHADHSSSKGV